jgi:hypothetical protein
MTFAGRILREYDATGRQSPDHPIACLVFDFTGQPDHYLSVGELCQLTSVMPAGTRQKLKPVAAITGERCSSGNLGKICLGSIARARSSNVALAGGVGKIRRYIVAKPNGAVAAGPLNGEKGTPDADITQGHRAAQGAPSMSVWPPVRPGTFLRSIDRKLFDLLAFN